MNLYAGEESLGVLRGPIPFNHTTCQRAVSKRILILEYDMRYLGTIAYYLTVLVWQSISPLWLWLFKF